MKSGAMCSLPRSGDPPGRGGRLPLALGVERFRGVDLAWGEGRDGGVVNGTGLVRFGRYGHILAAGWRAVWRH